MLHDRLDIVNRSGIMGSSQRGAAVQLENKTMNTEAANKFNTIANALPMVGDYVEVDGHKVGYTLRNGDDYVDCGFAGCQFRLGQWNNANGMPVNLEMSGRKARWIRGEWRYRVQITIVGDCEPDTVTHGWWLPVTGEYVETFRKSEDYRRARAI